MGTVRLREVKIIAALVYLTASLVGLLVPLQIATMVSDIGFIVLLALVAFTRSSASSMYVLTEFKFRYVSMAVAASYLALLVIWTTGPVGIVPSILRYTIFPIYVIVGCALEYVADKRLAGVEVVLEDEE